MEAYAQVRPAYPALIVDKIWERLDGATTPPRIVDMGAGTGIFTRQLLARGAQVTAVESAAEMRAELAAALDVEIVASVAERTGLPDAQFDAVTFAQSFHWMNPGQALAEAARLLRPGGLIAVVANQMDVRAAWVHRLTRIMRSGDVLSPEKGPRFAEPLGESEFFETAWIQELSVPQVLALARTRSAYVRQSEAGRAKMQANLRWYLLEHLGFCLGDTVRIPYRTFLWSARLNPGR